ncbi:methyltransferase domain-containing protein [Catellatospora tritici]|uniref:methyltransferase domain-containing protein n=1 Tax=Catellatospora tritici TaxID=2851566 RepID=UPI001C2D738D|nr:methyltransferase domain-containing protein [Catellatospora tritici]MBV1855566.1 methyltransferase domain-containing protein [Catellatospora tritici]
MADIAGLRARGSAFWTQAAPGWIRHADRQDDLGHPLGAVALTRLNPRPGEHVLDVGCGCGGTTAELAAAVGPTGAVLGVDLAESMVAAASTRFPPDHHPVLRFAAADVETVEDLPGAPFDAAYSRMALMLLADPVAGCANIRRMLRPGGRLAATVFRDGRANSWLPLAVLGAAPHVAALPPLPVGDEPGPFAFADPARVGRILTASGFDAVVVEPHDVVMAVPDEPDTVAEWLIEIGPAGAAYRAAPPPQQAAARVATAGLLARFRQPQSGYRLPAGLWLITATAP